MNELRAQVFVTDHEEHAQFTLACCNKMKARLKMHILSKHTLERLRKPVGSIAPIVSLMFMAMASLTINPSQAGAETGSVVSEPAAPTEPTAARSEIADALQDLRYGSSMKLAAHISGGDEGQPLFEPIDDVNATTFTSAGRKSPLKAGIMSLLIPGLGQVYNGSHLAKVGAFVGTEVALWSEYGRFNGIADRRIDEFEAFADQNWSEAEYRRYLFEAIGVTDSSDAGNQFTHHLPGTNTQQYYEMIGKYDQFSYGWTLAEGDTGRVYTSADNYDNNPFFSPLRLQYNNMRASANDAFGSRDRMVIFAMVNHLVSSVDAALGAARHNRALENGHSSFSISPAVEPDTDWSIIPKVNLSYHF